MRRLFQFALSIFFAAGIFSAGYAQSEAELDSMFLNPGGPTDMPAETASVRKLEIYGFAESENYFGATGKAANRDREIIKLECRVKLNLKYGDPFFHVFTSLDGYFYPEIYPDASAAAPARKQNPHLPGRQFAFEAQEAYIAGGDKLRFKAGKQLFGWGKADAFKVANYLDQADLRELFAKDKGDQNRGVFAISLKYLFSDFAVEAALVPLHHAPLYPAAGTFWAIQNVAQTIPYGGASFSTIPVTNNGTGLAAHFNNVSAAIRLGGTFGSLDAHISAHSGIDRSIFFQPVTTIPVLAAAGPPPDVSRNASVTLSPYYARVLQGGGEVAFIIDRFSLRSEVVYTNDKVAIVKDTAEASSSTRNNGGLELVLVNKVEREKYLAGTLGFDVKLWDDDSLILVEYTRAGYLKNNSRYFEEFLNNLAVIRIEDKVFDQRLEWKAGIILRPNGKDTGYAPNAETGWNFQNGLTVSLGAVFFYGDNDSLFKLYRDANLVFLRARYDF